MNEPLDELYLKWLYGHIALKRTTNPSRTHWNLARQLLKKEFVWFVPNDDNRCADGIDLRSEFVNEFNLHDVDQNWMMLGCSFLEMLIALSRRLSQHEERPPVVWFWHMMKNIGLDKINDKTPFDPAMVDEILETIIWRTYDENGRGGLFPLEHTDKDQRRVELWYQFNEYLLELESERMVNGFFPDQHKRTEKRGTRNIS